MIIVLFQLGISVYYGSKKSSLFIDEVLSYTLANRPEGGFLGLPQEEWLNEEWYIDNLSVNDEERFDYSIPYKNQIEDVHPPLFYFLFHTSSSFFPGKISYWIGLGWNVLFFLGCSVLLYFIGKELFKNEKCALLGAFLYSVSFGGLNTMTFIRMYMLLTFLLLSHVYVYIKFMDSEEIPLKAYFFLGLTLTLGVLTQYYFLIAAFFWEAWYTLKFLTRKRWKELFRYWETIVLSGCVSLVVFPAMLKHILFGGRGVEARNNFISGENYLAKLKSMFTILDSQMFYGILFVLISVLIILIVAGRIRGGGQQSIKGWKLLTACTGYFLLVTKVAPYQTDRYLMLIYPLIYIFLIGNLYLLFEKFINYNVVIVLFVVLFGGLSFSNLTRTELPYLYQKSVKEYNAVMKDYKENLCVYVGVESLYQYYAMQELKDYRGFYNIGTEIDEDDKDKIMSDLTRLQGEDVFILYIGNNYALEKTKNYLDEVLGGKYIKNVVQFLRKVSDSEQKKRTALYER